MGANRATFGLPGTARKWKLALVQLLEADYYARDLKRPPWEFAVELGILAEAGLTANDLCWLTAKGYIEQPVTAGRSSAQSKQIHRALGRTPSPRNLVVLTKSGLAFARRVCRARSGEESAAPSTDNNHVPSLDVLPRWESGSRTLWLGPTLIKQYRVPALNQELVLAAFAEEGWPTFVDDPLPPTTGIEAKHRLHDTIVRLNRAQKHRLIRFHGNGNGLAVHWERISPAASIVTKASPDRL